MQAIKRVLCLAALFAMVCAGACAETVYQSQCTQHGLNREHVIAWLEIPEASILEAVMRHPEDDAYYAAHAPSGEEKTTGSLYVQARYNAADFSDPVTLIYGSSATELAPFGMLQETYSGNFDGCRQIYLHTPQGTSEYVVFAAVPHSSVHILHYYDFRVERRYNSFFDGVFSTRALGMHLAEDGRPEAGKDQVLILSTALRGDALQRYLVMARKVTSSKVAMIENQ